MKETKLRNYPKRQHLSTTISSFVIAAGFLFLYIQSLITTEYYSFWFNWFILFTAWHLIVSTASALINNKRYDFLISDLENFREVYIKEKEGE